MLSLVFLSLVPLALSTPLAAGSPPPSSSSSSSPSQPLNPISEHPPPADRIPLSALPPAFQASSVCSTDHISTPSSVKQDCYALLSSLSAFHLPYPPTTPIVFYPRRPGGSPPRPNNPNDSPPPSLGVPFVAVRNRCKLVLDIRNANGNPQGAGAWQRDPPAQDVEFTRTSVAAVQQLALDLLRLCFWEETLGDLGGWDRAGWTVAGTGINGNGAGGLGVWLKVLEDDGEPAQTQAQGIGCVGPLGACFGGGSVLD